MDCKGLYRYLLKCTVGSCFLVIFGGNSAPIMSGANAVIFNQGKCESVLLYLINDDLQFYLINDDLQFYFVIIKTPV
jgi:hypothetical protein